MNRERQKAKEKRTGEVVKKRGGMDRGRLQEFGELDERRQVKAVKNIKCGEIGEESNQAGVAILRQIYHEYRS